MIKKLIYNDSINIPIEMIAKEKIVKGNIKINIYNKKIRMIISTDENTENEYNIPCGQLWSTLLSEEFESKHKQASLGSLHVDSRYRNSGIGTAMLKIFLYACKKLNIDNICGVFLPSFVAAFDDYDEEESAIFYKKNNIDIDDNLQMSSNSKTFEFNIDQYIIDKKSLDNFLKESKKLQQQSITKVSKNTYENIDTLYSSNEI